MLKVSNISKIFNNGTVNEKIALDNINLEVADTDFITIVGSNGAGKSTLFNAIGGSFLTDSGNIKLDDKDITFMPNYKRSKYIGRLFQDPLSGTAPNMTIEENLALAYLRASDNFHPFSHITKKEKDFFYDKLKMLNIGLEDRMKVPVGTLSGGQRQALTLLMATIIPPKLLLLDEHTASLDPSAALKIMNLTKEIVEKNHLTCLMITHNMQQAINFGNRILMMENGHIILDIKEKEKDNLSVQDLINLFAKSSGKNLDNDRMLL